MKDIVLFQLAFTKL